jgi:hypothetical protein
VKFGIHNPEKPQLNRYIAIEKWSSGLIILKNPLKIYVSI